MKKCKIYTVPGSTHTGFFLTTDHKSLHLCNEVTVDFTSLLIYKFCFKVLTLFKKEKIKRKGGRNYFLQQAYVLCPNLLPPLLLVQYRAAASLKHLISKDVPESSPTAAPQASCWGWLLFSSSALLNLSQFHHFHSHLKNFMDSLPEAMKIIVNQPFSFKDFLSNIANKSQKLCRLF